MKKLKSALLILLFAVNFETLAFTSIDYFSCNGEFYIQNKSYGEELFKCEKMKGELVCHNKGSDKHHLFKLTFAKSHFKGLDLQKLNEALKMTGTSLSKVKENKVFSRWYSKIKDCKKKFGDFDWSRGWNLYLNKTDSPDRKVKIIGTIEDDTIYLARIDWVEGIRKEDKEKERVRLGNISDDDNVAEIEKKKGSFLKLKKSEIKDLKVSEFFKLPKEAFYSHTAAKIFFDAVEKAEAEGGKGKITGPGERKKAAIKKIPSVQKEYMKKLKEIEKAHLKAK